ncbi:CdaR family protein [Sporosarcina jiandibaonis]|uniref:CdaR family protein n=1 Tax=Sporosarcina jiandibaonis TaxID=2715535 RepID=UPI00155219EE|nr:CdaR family protein [Sporosarcina jiandibaonis]
MDRIMDNPWFLRFTALFLAVILFYSVQTDDKEQNGNKVGDHLDMISDVPVEVYYDNENLVVTGVPETVNITIEGPINLVQTTKMLKDFSLFVDLRTLTMGRHQVSIQSENISEKLQVRIDPAMVNVLIEEKITETFKVEPEFNKRLLADDFHVSSIDVVPSVIEVTGAKSIVESISFVKATVSSENGVRDSFEQQAKIRVLDRDLNKLDVTIVPETVKVKVEVVENNKEVPIEIKATGTPPDNVTIDSLSSASEKITIFGPSKILDTIDAVTVDVDMSKLKESQSMEITIPKPKGVSAMSISKVKVDVKATVEEPEEETEAEAEKEDNLVDDIATEEAEPATETISFENVEIHVNGLDQKFKSTLIKPENGLVTLTVVAEPDIIDKLAKTDFTVSIDASETVAEGEDVYPVTVEGPENLQWTLSEEEVTMRIELA